jgi:hypothetical protein
LTNVCDICDLENIVKCATCFTKGADPTLIDVKLTNKKFRIFFHSPINKQSSVIFKNKQKVSRVIIFCKLSLSAKPTMPRRKKAGNMYRATLKQGINTLNKRKHKSESIDSMLDSQFNNLLSLWREVLSSIMWKTFQNIAI